jgi:CRP/FNR family transcriptional regulator, anaerobic regulatory protein
MDTINEITFYKIEDRVRNYLRKVSTQQNSVTIEATHLSIANDLGTTRVVISKILKKMENDALVELLRGKIVLKKALFHEQSSHKKLKH